MSFIPSFHTLALLAFHFLAARFARLELSGRVGTFAFLETAWITFALADDVRQLPALIPYGCEPFGVYSPSE
jgi:hypothetical protein